uniref:Polycomb protein VEFS-Box domain-containing protein n=1 Tax=Meloidogyne javanica TaxID=6303 RepID=A0A915NEQ4_MELJA
MEVSNEHGYGSIYDRKLIPGLAAKTINPQLNVNIESTVNAKNRSSLSSAKLNNKTNKPIRNKARFMRSSLLELSNLDVDDKHTIVSSVNSVRDNITASMPVNSGINFKGVLPFNGSKYRFNQITDLLPKEKRFFVYWNEFIGKPINKELAQYQMPMLMKRFIFEFGERLKTYGLFSNFVQHCAVLRDFNFISDEEMRNALIYVLLFQKR